MQRKLSQLPVNGNTLRAAQNMQERNNPQVIAFSRWLKASEVER